MDMMMEEETVYNSHDESHIVMSEKVQSLAGTIYQEFERMIGKYDEDVVKDLMPLVVNILECLDLAYTENQEHEVEVELLREDNEQLVTQYEREKQLRKGSEQKLLELEDIVEEEKKQCQTKVESLESIVRMFELKNRNASDHANRMEDKVDELKKEYSKLHERYTELFKTHMDYMERTKILCGTDRLDQMGGARSRLPGINLSNLNRSSGPVSYGFSSLDPNKSLSSAVDMTGSANGILQVSSLRNELQEAQVGPDTPVGHTDKGQLTDTIEHAERGTATKGGWVDGFSPDTEDMDQSSPEIEDLEDISMDMSYGPDDIKSKKLRQSTTTTHKEERTGNNLYQELQFQEPDALADIDEGADITDSGSEKEGEEEKSFNVTDNFFGMGKEVENLILENTELLTTKNALNIVKDDLIAKVDELTSEQEILREEITSLNAVKSRLRLRVQELEDEVKKLKEDFEKNNKANKSDDEDVPMAQRKRFTRVEMARVLMERNQYKERFMELQEAVRWTEMIRASRNDPEADKKNKQTIWKFFSNLFSTSEKPQRKPLPYGNIRYNAPTHQVTPALDTMRRRNLVDHRRRGLEYFENEFVGETVDGACLEERPAYTSLETPLTDGPSSVPPGSSSEKLQQRRASERREQYKQVRAHVKKDDGRLQAYGWSLPAKTGQGHGQHKAIEGPHGSAQSQSQSKSSHVPVPVPVYCRPLMEKEPGMKIWCAAGVNLTGGRTKDGGNVFGASVFYSGENIEEITDSNDVVRDEIDKIDKELKDTENVRKEGETMEQSLSSLVWICTSTHSISKVTVIDANNPADILESFHVCSSHLLCIASVPGAKESDYSMDEDMNKIVEEAQQFQQENYQHEQRQASPEGSLNSSDFKSKEDSGSVGTLTFISCGTGSDAGNEVPLSSPTEQDNDEIVPVLRKEIIETTDPDKDSDRAEVESEAADGVPVRRFLKDPEGVIKDGVEQEVEPSPDNIMVREEVEKMSSFLATMWLGSQSGSIYVHSAVRQWKRCLHSIKLKDSVLSIVHIRGRVLAALADGTVAIFHRKGDCQWDLTNYHLLDLGRPHHSIRCMHVVHDKVWCGYRNKIHVVSPKSMCVEKTFDAHPRKESQVRQMAWIGDGVWVSIRLDSTLRLYNAHTHQHLQDVDIEPYVSKMLGTGKLGFSFVRITALLISSNRLWIGTGNGVIISVPLSEGTGSSTSSSCGSGPASISSHPSIGGARMPGGVVRVYADNLDQVTAGSFIPYCSMAQAQLSFHGHRDAVKFFVAVPGLGGYPAFTAVQSAMSTATIEPGSDGETSTNKPKSMLVISGGEGYIDFRIGEGEEDIGEENAPEKTVTSLSKGEQSHLIVWSVVKSFGD